MSVQIQHHNAATNSSSLSAAKIEAVDWRAGHIRRYTAVPASVLTGSSPRPQLSRTQLLNSHRSGIMTSFLLRYEERPKSAIESTHDKREGAPVSADLQSANFGTQTMTEVRKEGLDSDERFLAFRCLPHN